MGKTTTDYMREWRERNPGKATEISREWRLSHPGYCKIKSKEYYNRNVNKCRKMWRDWYKNNQDKVLKYRKETKEHCKEYMRLYRENKPELSIMRDTVRRMLKKGCLGKSNRSRKYIGCHPEFLRGWLESQFRNGMTWDNYGSVWVVDHVVPLSWWDIRNYPEHIYEASHYSNLQPMFISENMEKGNRYA